MALTHVICDLRSCRPGAGALLGGDSGLSWGRPTCHLLGEAAGPADRYQLACSLPPRGGWPTFFCSGLGWRLGLGGGCLRATWGAWQLGILPVPAAGGACGRREC